MNPVIKQVTISGADVQRIVFDRLMPAIEDEAFEPSVMSLLILAVLMMRPELDNERLQDVVMDLTEHLMLLLTDPVAEGMAN